MARTALGGVTALLLALTVVPAAAQPAHPPAASASQTLPDTGFEEVPFDLASRSFKRVLPFDVPFQISGTAPKGVTKITLQYAESPKRLQAIKAPQGCQPAPGGQAVTKETVQVAARTEKDNTPVPFKPEPPLIWTSSPLLDTDPAGPHFIVTVPPLDALRYYLFKFDIESQVPREQIAEIQKLARGLFDKKLDQLPAKHNLTPDEAEAIRMQLIAGVKSLLGADLVIAPGTIFDPCLPPANVRRDFLNSLRPVAQARDKIINRLDNLRNERQSLEKSLEEVKNNTLFQKLLSRLEDAAKTDPSIATFLEQEGGANLAAANMISETDLLGPRLPPSGPGSAALAAAGTANLVTTYDTTVSRLESLRDWLLGATGVSQLGTPADKQVLDDLIKGPLKEATDLAKQLRANAEGLESAVGNRDRQLDELAQQVQTIASEEVRVDATTTGNANTFQRYYISFDLGFLYAWRVSKVVPYAGTNIYFRPINTNVPLSQKDGLSRRFSVTLGYTLQGIADTTDLTRRDFVQGGGSLVVGAGLRLTESIRFAAGALLFFKKNRNPLVSGEAVAAAPYISFSFDMNVAKTFTKIGQVFFSNQ